MQKNVKGIIALCCALASFVLLVVAVNIATHKIEGTEVSLYGDINVTMAFVGAGLGVLAIIIGILSLKDRDKKGPRKAGIIVGVFAIIASLLSAGAFALTNEIVKYWNPNEKSTMIEDLVKDNADMKKQLDEQYQKMLDEAKK